MVQGCGLDSFGSRNGSMVCSCEHNTVPLGAREYLHQLVKYYPLNKDSAPRGLLYNFFPFINVCFSVTKCDGIISNVQVVTHRIERTGEPLHILQQVINCLATYFVGLLKLQEKDWVFLRHYVVFLRSSRKTGLKK